MSIFKTGSTPFNSVGPFRFHRDPSVRDALDVERRSPWIGAAAPARRKCCCPFGATPPGRGQDPRRQHLYVDARRRWKLDQINLRYRDVLASMLCFTPFRTAVKQFFDQLTGEGAGRRSKGAGRRGDDGAGLEMASAPGFAKKA